LEFHHHAERWRASAQLVLWEPDPSFNPTYLLVIDGAFVSLFVVPVVLAVLTRDNLHLIFLTLIELALWVSVHMIPDGCEGAHELGHT
jgi:hypothetical protein